MHAAEPAGRHHLDAGRAAHRERAADGGRADRALCDRSGDVARAELPRVGAEPVQLIGREPDDDLAVEHADRRRHRAACADRGLRREPDLDAFARREPVRDERRLQRDDRARGANLVRHADHGIAPICAQQRAAVATAELGPADEEAGGERVTGARRVDDLDVDRRMVDAVDAQPARAALQHPAGVERADRVLLALGREDELGRERRDTCAERVVDERPRRDVESDGRAVRARVTGRGVAPRRRSVRGAASSRRCGARRNRTTPVRDRAARARARCRGRRPSSGRPTAAIETTTPVRPATGPRCVTPRSRQLAQDELAGRIGCRSRPTKVASAPRLAAHAATFAA